MVSLLLVEKVEDVKDNESVRSSISSTKKNRIISSLESASVQNDHKKNKDIRGKEKSHLELWTSL
jgi:hypothetical protein